MSQIVSPQPPPATEDLGPVGPLMLVVIAIPLVVAFAHFFH